MEKILSLDIGGTFIKCGLVSEDGSLFFEEKKLTPGNYGDFLDLVKDTAEDVPEKPSGLALALPGAYDIKNDELFAPNFPALNGKSVKGDAEKAAGVKAVAENDANLAALGEYVFAEKKALRNMIFITLGTGFGGGLILNGKLFQSEVTLFEAGHMSVDPEGRSCGCGRRGCLDEYATSGGLMAAYCESGGVNSGMTPQKLGKLASQGDLKAKEAFEIYADILAGAFANLANIFCPEKIKIGGGLSELSEFFLPKTIEKFDEMIFPLYKGKVKIEKSVLGNVAGMLGGAALFFGL